MSRFSLPPSSLHAEKRLSSRILVSLLLTVVTLFITCPKVVAQDTLEYQSVAREYYRRAGAWVVPATMANKKGLAILATGSNVVGVNAPNGTSDFPDQVLLPRSVVSQSSTVFAAMPFSCLGLPLKSDIAIGMNMTSAAEHSHLPITAFAAMPYLRKHAIRLDPGNGKIEVLQEVEASNGDSELSIEWVKDRPSIPIEFPTLGRRSLRVDTGGSGYVALEADRVKALVRMGHIVQRQFG